MEVSRVFTFCTFSNLSCLLRRKQHQELIPVFRWCACYPIVSITRESIAVSIAKLHFLDRSCVDSQYTVKSKRIPRAYSQVHEPKRVTIKQSCCTH